MQLACDLTNPLAVRQALFISADGQPFTTSRAVAEIFARRHSNILRAIDNLLADSPDAQFNRRNFLRAEYRDAAGRQLRPEYRLTYDGFKFLVGRFTGRKAIPNQIAFNTLEAELRRMARQFELVAA